MAFLVDSKRDRVNINSDSLYVVHLLCNIVWVYFSVVCICACVHRMCLYMCMSMCEYSDISWETFKVFRSNRREVFHKIFCKVLRKVLLMETFNQVTRQGTCFPRVFQNSLFIEHFQVAASENFSWKLQPFVLPRTINPSQLVSFYIQNKYTNSALWNHFLWRTNKQYFETFIPIER